MILTALFACTVPTSSITKPICMKKTWKEHASTLFYFWCAGGCEENGTFEFMIQHRQVNNNSGFARRNLPTGIQVMGEAHRLSKPPTPTILAGEQHESKQFTSSGFLDVSDLFLQKAGYRWEKKKIILQRMQKMLIRIKPPIIIIMFLFLLHLLPLLTNEKTKFLKFYNVMNKNKRKNL